MPPFEDVPAATRTFFFLGPSFVPSPMLVWAAATWAAAANLGKDGGSRLTPVVENRARFTLFGGGVFPIFPPGWRSAAAAREGVPGATRAPPGEAECVEDTLNLGDDLLGTRPDRPMAWDGGW